jgi:hypothetical protein
MEIQTEPFLSTAEIKKYKRVFNKKSGGPRTQIFAAIRAKYPLRSNDLTLEKIIELHNLVKKKPAPNNKGRPTKRKDIDGITECSSKQDLKKIYSLVALKTYCRSIGISIAGKKGELVDKVWNSINSQTPEPVDVTPVSEPVAATPVSAPVAAMPVSEPVADTPISEPVAVTPVSELPVNFTVVELEPEVREILAYTVTHIDTGAGLWWDSDNNLIYSKETLLVLGKITKEQQDRLLRDQEWGIPLKIESFIPINE